MAGTWRRPLVSALLLACVIALGWSVARFGGDVAPEPSASALPAAAAPLQAGEKITFLELGGVGCKACEAMVPVLQAVRERFADQVEVIFHDVRKNPAIARQYRVLLIPTQVFLLPDGSEFFRHEGHLPLPEVEKVLRRMGVRPT